MLRKARRSLLEEDLAAGPLLEAVPRLTQTPSSDHATEMIREVVIHEIARMAISWITRAARQPDERCHS